MKKNLYYRQVFKRTNIVQYALLNLFLAIASWPRLLLEVFIRRNFGERYFSWMSALTVAGLLAVYPYGTSGGFTDYLRPSITDVITSNVGWYLFIAAFLCFSVVRWLEIKRQPSVFDLGRFSLSSGDIHPRFYALRIDGKAFDIRTIETLLEPGFFLIIGFVLHKLGQDVGMLLMACSVVYSFSYRAAYRIGDDLVMDNIDELIFNMELFRSFVEGLDPSQTRGVRFYGRRPADPEARRNLADTFVEKEEVVEAR